MVFKRYEGETDEQLIYRICSEKEMIGTWEDVSKILNELLGNSFNESTYRKKYQSFKQILEANQDKFTNDEQTLEDIKQERRELEMEKTRFRDERNEWSKQNRIGARVLDKLDKLEDALLSRNRIYFDDNVSIEIKSDNDLLVVLSDLHIGQTFSSYFGKYNTDIAIKRLKEYYDEILSLQKIFNSKNCYISLQGDMISNSIHKTLAITNRENVIEQIKIASELISSFCADLCKHFTKVYFISVCGNHSRIDRKEDALHDERLDDLIAWSVRLSLSTTGNFIPLNANIDNGIAKFQIRGKTYVSVHGDYDSFDEKGIGKLSLMLGEVPYGIIYGHLHEAGYLYHKNVNLIRGGSLAGAGDDYTIEKRLIGKPSQIVCVCNDKGIKGAFPIVFD